MARGSHLQEKIVTAVLFMAPIWVWSIAADYLVNVVILVNPHNFTPVPDAIVGFIAAFPILFVFNSYRIDLRSTKEDLAAARDAAEAASRQALEERNAALEANAAKSSFLAKMSHELRTPLNAIIGFSEMIQLGLAPQRTEEYARTIAGSGQHLLSLINDILDLSKIEAGKLELFEETFAVGDWVGECAAMIAPRAAAGALALSLRHDEATLTADRRLMRQALLNLLANAVKFTRAGGTIRVEATVQADGSLCVAVEDSGVGIAAEDLAKVFEPFGQGRHDIAQTEHGTGLGLPIVRGILEAHGGAVEIASEPGKGTCVRMRLPAGRMHALAARVA